MEIIDSMLGTEINQSLFGPISQAQMKQIPSPSYVVSEKLLRSNLEILKSVADSSGAKVILALKGFSMHSMAPLVSEYLSGICASGLWEAKLGEEFFQGEIHSYSPALKLGEFEELSAMSHHLSLNSASQWKRFLPYFHEKCSYGLRINPEVSQAEVELYDPCSEMSRLGCLRAEFDQLISEDSTAFDLLDGLHFHALCEQGSEELGNILERFTQDWGDVLERVSWVNFGGGHHITKPGYNKELLVKLVQEFAAKFDVQVYLEPGEAIAIHTGYLVSEVVDVIENQRNNVLLDISCTCHMPDVLEMPYRPEVFAADYPGVKSHTYRLGGVSCLAGDVIGEWSFDKELRVGDRVVFDDMSHYTMVKTTTFNGVRHPSIVVIREDDSVDVIREFEYADFRTKLS